MSFPRIAVVAFLTLCHAAPLAQAQHIPTLGETFGAQASDVLNAIRDGRRKVAEMNAALHQARQRFWKLYPDGKDLKEAEAAYSRALLEKDLYYLHVQLAKQLAGAAVPDADERIGMMQRVMGEVDGGIHPMAQRRFFAWAGAVQARGLEGTAEEFAEYAKARNQAEYFIGPKSPLRSDDQKEYLLGVIMRGTEGFPSLEEAKQQYETLAGIVGEEALLAAAGAGMTASRNDPGWRSRDPYYVLKDEQTPTGFGGQRQQQLVQPEPYIDGVIHPKTPRGQVIAMLYAGRPPGNQWVGGWQHAQERYREIVAAHGEAQVHRAADLIERAPKDFWGGTRWVLIEPHVLGMSEREPIAAFMHLIALPSDDFERIETAFNELTASREKVTPPDFKIIHAGDQQLQINRLVGGVDGVLYALATTPPKSHLGQMYNTIVRLNTDDSDLRIVYKFNEDGEGEWDTDRDRTTLYLGPNGTLYGSIGKGYWVKKPSRPGRTDWDLRHPKGAIYRLSADGSDFKVLRSFSDEDGTGGRVSIVDKQGLVFGTIHNSRLFGQAPAGNRDPWGIFRMNGDGSGFSILYHRWKLGPDGRLPLSLVDGDDGYLYGSQQAMEPNPLKRGVRVWTEIFRLPKHGGELELLHEGPILEVQPKETVGARHITTSIQGLALKLIAGSDGALYGYTNFSAGGDAGHIFRINRDGSGYTVLHRSTSWGGHLIEAGGMLYFFGRDKSSGARLFRLAGDGGSYPTIFDADVVGIASTAATLLAHGDALFGAYLAELPDRSQRQQVYRMGLSALPAPMAYSSGAVRPAESYEQSRVEAAQQQEQEQAALDARMGSRRPPAPAPAAPAPQSASAPPPARAPERTSAPPPRRAPTPGRGSAPLRAEQTIKYDGVRIDFTGGQEEIDELKAAAAANNARACLLLGELTDQGKIEGGTTEAVKWFEKGHELNDAECTARLALHLMMGRGVEDDDPRRDPAKLRQLATIAMARRSALGTYLFAECIAKGIGMPANETLARRYYIQAAKLGHPLAQKWCKENNVAY